MTMSDQLSEETKAKLRKIGNNWETSERWDNYFGKRPRGAVDPYARERKLLRRIERCKTEEGKVRAIVWALRFDTIY